MWKKLCNSSLFLNVWHFDRLTNSLFLHSREKRNLSGLTYWTCIPHFSFKGSVRYWAFFDFLALQQLWPDLLQLQNQNSPSIFSKMLWDDLIEPDIINPPLRYLWAKYSTSQMLRLPVKGSGLTEASPCMCSMLQKPPSWRSSGAPIFCFVSECLSVARFFFPATRRTSTFLGFQIPASFQKRKGIRALLFLG